MKRHTALADNMNLNRGQRLRVVSERRREPLARKHWKWIGLLAVGYLVTTFLSRFFVIPPEALAPIWLPAGVLLGAMLLLPWSAALLALLAAFLASVAGNWMTHVPLGASVAYSFANCACGLLSTLALKGFSRPAPRVSELRGAIKLMVLGAVVGNGLGATIGAYIVHSLGQGGFGDAWLIWFLSNAWGILIVVPIISEWGRIRGFFTKVVPQAWVELLVIAGILGTIMAVTWTRNAQATFAFIAPFVVFPLLVWVALRFGTPGAAVGSFVVSSLVLIRTGHGVGRFAMEYQSLHTRFVELQVFMTMATICSLVAAAIMSDREHAEISLRYSNSIVESSDAAIIGKRLDGTITSWNPGAERMYGYSREEAIGKNISFLASENQDDEMPAIMERLRAGARIADYETVRRRKDGALLEVAVNISPIYDKHGRIVGASSIARNITDKKRAERELRETHQWLQLSFDAADMGAWDWNLLTDELKWFGRQEQLFGFAPGTFNGRGESAIQRIHPDDRERVRQEIASWMFQKRRDYLQEFRIVWPDGTEHWTAAVGRFSYEGDRAARCIGINRDITERKLAEKTLRQTEESLARTQELSLVMPLHVSLNGEWLRVPQRFCEFLGYTHDELIGMPFRNVTHADDFWEDWAQCQRLIAGEINSFEMEKRFIRKDGAITWGYLNCSAVKDEAGNPIYFLTYVRDINKEKSVAEALSESEERFRSLFENAAVGIEKVAVDGRLLVVNPALCRMLGYTQQQLLQMTFADITHPEDLQRETLLLDSLLKAQRNSYEIEKRYVRRDGSPLWVHITSSSVTDAHGKVLYRISVVQDINERKQTEEALRESEARFRTTFENVAMGMAQVALDGRWLRVNERLCEIVGYTREEMETMRFQDITHPDDLTSDVAKSEALVRGEIESYSMEKRYIHKDGHTVWVNLTVGLQPATGGQPAYFISAVDDITDRKRAEQALRKSEQRLRVLTEALPQLVWTADAMGNIDYVNRRWCAFTGQTRHQALGHGSFEAVHPDDISAVQQNWINAVVSGTQHQLEMRLRSKDGQYRWFLARGVPLRNEEGKIERWFGTCTDIHDMKMAQQALIRSEKLASVGRMAMTIAHEINNPLAAVMNTLFLTRSEPGLPSRAQQFLEMADGELRRISHITRQALGFYRESATPKVTSVNELLDSVTELLKAKIGAKRLDVRKGFKSNIEITAISGELRQVFSNLISNAIDAMDPRGQLRLRVSRSIDAKGQHVVRISVADNGHGISPTALPHIFEPFFTTKDTIGTGLGLWVSKQIVDKHKGCIRVRSCAEGPRHGTVFSVVLPMQMEAEQVECPSSPATMAS